LLVLYFLIYNSSIAAKKIKYLLIKIKKFFMDNSLKVKEKNLIRLVESKFIRNYNLSQNGVIENQKLREKDNIKVGDILKIGYKIPEGEKERIQIYEGLVICKKNKNLGKTFTIRRNVQGIGIEQIFLLNSPKIASLTIKQSSKIRRAKLYFIRNLKGKAARLKRKI
jgi:large subunit ribosomal protein L19